ncbi:hypothetical protein AUK40_01220 [Candidatus Wirthbacteria bacterium CG2_30_54_11]|uniref:L-asparaginase N-terminal domain-containing protein n=1 Tax=Candidatus Wirthbacteria bacterium CG2_30_54_11 TaxID=1817892 RepID=A0A1J5IPX2_9BACT|nr:MAG: hypothetical protein AUK40_01220 [Candidatus Wirthbacteria bacterium CG2_30_54_11]
MDSVFPQQDLPIIRQPQDQTKTEKNKTDELHTIATGGTIDSHWEPTKDTVISNTQSIIPQYLRNVRLPHHDVSSETIILKDSREIDLATQKIIGEQVAESAHLRILVTTGTYLMPDIAGAIFHHPACQQFGRMDKMVVVTGGTIPLKGFSISDSGFNLGMSAAILQDHPDIPVALVMSGMCLDVSKGVKKDLTSAVFVNSGYLDEYDVLGYKNFFLIPAGGSIDFELDHLDGLRPARDSAIPNYLRTCIRMQRPFYAINPFIKDSRDLTDENLKLIADIINDNHAQHILITTGLYKIQKIQQYLRNTLTGDNLSKRIILTGSRIPLGSGEISDAPFNLGYALGKMATLPPGVHVALNGVIMSDAENVIDLLYTPEEKAILRAKNNL